MLKGQVYQNSLNNRKFRVFKTSDDNIYCLDMPIGYTDDGRTKLLRNKYENPYVIDKATFMVRLRDGQFFPVLDPFRTEVMLLDINKKSKWAKSQEESGRENKSYKKALLKREVAEDLIENHIDQVISPKSKSKTYKEIGAAYGVSENSARNYLTEYVVTGMNLAGLLPDNINIGNKGKRKNHNKRPGPKPKVEAGLPLSKMVHIYETYINENMTNGFKESGVDTVSRILVNEFPRIEGLKDINAPVNERQFHYYLRTERQKDPVRFLKASMSEREFEREHRNLYHTVDEDCEGIMQMAEIDSTVLPVYLVSVFDRKRFIGMPTLFLLVDVKSRMILGYDLSFDPACWNSALRTYVNCCSDKVEYCRKFGFDIEFKDWPVMGRVPDITYADNAEMKGQAASGYTERLESEVVNVPAYRGDMKPLVERRFGRPSTFLREQVIGGIPKDVITREDEDYRIYARLNIKEIERLVIKEILNYNTMAIGDFTDDVYQFVSEEKYSPLELWNLDMRDGLYFGIPEEPTVLEKAILPEHSGTIRRGRIRFRNLEYIPTEENRAWANSLGDKSVSVDFLYSTQDTSMIFVLDKEAIREFELIKKQKGFGEMSVPEIEEIKETRQKKRVFDRQDDLYSQGNLIEFSDDLQDSAIKEWESTPGKNVIKGAAEAKRQERAILNPVHEEYTITESQETRLPEESEVEPEFDFSNLLEEINN